METVTTSKQFTLNWQDAGKGFAVAVFSAFVTGAYQYMANLITTGSALVLPGANDLKTMGFVAVFAGVGYLFKNFIQPSQTIIVPPVTVIETDKP